MSDLYDEGKAYCDAQPDLRELCEYCDGKYTGLPGNACENCMNTGLKYPQLSSERTRAATRNRRLVEDAVAGLEQQDE